MHGRGAVYSRLRSPPGGQGVQASRRHFSFMEEVSVLVLSRKKNESIVVNNNITVTVVSIEGDRVRLGIEAPKEVPVNREEIHLRLLNGSQQASA